MQLSRLCLDPEQAAVRRDLSDPYEMHRTLSRAFVSDESQSPTRYLWRLEPDQSWAAPVVLVQSTSQANWDVLQKVPGYLVRGVESRPLASMSDLSAGQSSRFRLIANPTVCRQGKRCGLNSEVAQLEWLERQGQRYGFRVEAALVTASEMIGLGPVSRRISIQRAAFDGRLQIIDPERLATALQAGIGPGKAFGMGLLSLAML